MESNESLKTKIGESLRRLRKNRALKQEDLYRFLGISQPQYSKIERGQASLTAEQLIQIIKRFNLPLSEFFPSEKSAEGTLLQNALVRLGADHLREIPDVAPSQRFSTPNDVIAHVLLTASTSRQIASLAPVLVKNFEQLNFNWIRERLSRQGLEARLGWLIDNTIRSLEERSKEGLIPRDLKLVYRRALLYLERKKKILESRQSLGPEDELDPGIISQKTLTSMEKNRDELARKWHIITAITLDDFYRALKDAE